jgi:HD-GYP domain-containing protein (c-di-GMP phosphodiesterase class II)
MTPDDASLLKTQLDTAPVPQLLREELDTALWIERQVREGRRLPVLEADAVSHSLFVALQQHGPAGVPQLPLADMSHYVAVHAVNVSLLAMALGESVGLHDGEVRQLGMAALLHDIGMARMPAGVLAKAEQLDAAERERIRQHPLEGARIIVDADASLDLAAVVAFEHHLRPDGAGYPALTFPRSGHYASRLVQLCDIYHALRSPRPFRKAWPLEIVFSFINERAGFEFDPELAAALTRMLQQRPPADGSGADGPDATGPGTDA